ncbi:ACP S-malonyltransferase [Thioalkalivibrio sp. XN279]|uniref:ACP S-malonyltransferase n=1 Tax=Thioalkalivibrio sp. XN279 TaxID=2714953 RepID=UPI00140E1168|nr:ACP S-malonyltransferase [Thioalkalivibrio sp. XN279]NHA14459.1 ACP S-malonyltransferase [Thioalkalivibrio sp. XN279]
MSIAAVFPGQGSQSVGMLAGLLAAEPAAAAALAEASEALGYDLAALLRDGPAERLNQTEITQPAMLAAGVAAWRAWQAHGGRMAAAMAGHSLGEYTALVCAGAMEFADALRIVQLRGRRMQEAVPAGAGAVAAVLGLDDDAVRTACEAAAAEGGVVEAVNFNAPGQVVIAGDAAAVARAIEHARAAGARRAMSLPVSVPVHCALMDPVGAQLQEALSGIEIRPPVVPVYHNIDATPRTAPDEIRHALARQVHSPVRWVECVLAMQRAGATTMVEYGPGRVLCGLARRIDRALDALPVEDADTLATALEATGGAQHA